MDYCIAQMPTGQTVITSVASLEEIARRCRYDGPLKPRKTFKGLLLSSCSFSSLQVYEKSAPRLGAEGEYLHLATAHPS